MAKKVTTIPATVSRKAVQQVLRKRRVAGYARVSTDLEEQQSSYEAQMEYYTNYIANRNDWEFAGMYSDEGITGTNTKHRDGFNSMIRDALDGKIDLIITKSVSRFARNTVDSLMTVRKLKDKGIEIYFEKENIWTLDTKGELLITIMSSLAQEESRSISENTTWGKRKSFEQGNVSVAYSRFLGYDKGFKINEEQAETVRMIYRLYLGGLTCFTIARKLEKLGRKTAAGGDKWHPDTIKNILTNEKYKGDAMLQKSYTVDFLSKKRETNNGEVPKYYIEAHHPGIIKPEEFDAVQAEIKRRTGKRYSGASIFSSKMICGDCGSFYGSKVWHSNDKYRRTIWRCNKKYDKRTKRCSSPHLTEDEIKDLFIDALNKTIKNKNEIIENMMILKETMQDTDELQSQAQELRVQLVDLVKESEQGNHEYEELAREYQEKSDSLKELQDKIEYEKPLKDRIDDFVNWLAGSDDVFKDFDETLWCAMVESVKVKARDDIEFKFKSGYKVKTCMPLKY